MRKNNRKGFTIVELVIVIAVIAILSAVLIPTFAGVTNKAKESAALQEVRSAYTSYVADALEDNVEPAEKIWVVHSNGVAVKVTDGKAEVATEDSMPTGYTEFTLTDGVLAAKS
jgi:prepilin-type N-terminal cleavage/methylation domain-containing protein